MRTRTQTHFNNVLFNNTVNSSVYIGLSSGKALLPTVSRPNFMEGASKSSARISTYKTEALYYLIMLYVLQGFCNTTQNETIMHGEIKWNYISYYIMFYHLCWLQNNLSNVTTMIS